MTCHIKYSMIGNKVLCSIQKDTVDLYIKKLPSSNTNLPLHPSPFPLPLDNPESGLYWTSFFQKNKKVYNYVPMSLVSLVQETEIAIGTHTSPPF